MQGTFAYLAGVPLPECCTAKMLHDSNQSTQRATKAERHALIWSPPKSICTQHKKIMQMKVQLFDWKTQHLGDINQNQTGTQK